MQLQQGNHFTTPRRRLTDMPVPGWIDADQGGWTDVPPEGRVSESAAVAAARVDHERVQRLAVAARAHERAAAQLHGMSERVRTITRASFDEGRHAGVREGYVQGVKWGAVCGTVATALLAALAFGYWVGR